MPSPNRHALDVLIAEVFRLSGALVAAGDALSEPLGLTSARWQVLGTITVTGGATVAELARRNGLARQSVQRVVTELANDRYVELIDNPKHKRAKKVVLTEKGRQAHQTITAAWAPIAEDLSERIGSDLLTKAARVLAELREEFGRLASTPAAAKQDMS